MTWPRPIPVLRPPSCSAGSAPIRVHGPPAGFPDHAGRAPLPAGDRGLAVAARGDLPIDLHRDHAASAYLRTGAQAARETGHAEIAAWCLQTKAGRLLTGG